MIDFHCHIDLCDDPIAVVRELSSSQTYVLSVTTTPKAFPKTSRLAKGNKRIRTALGLHPQLVAERSGELSLFELLLPETRYVGEVGLDGGREFSSSFPAQIEIFSEILRMCARSKGKILSIHSRHAASAVLDALEKQPDCGTPVLHWFTGTATELERAIRLGCWFSVGKPMFRSKKGCDAINRIPRDRILTETDAPFTDQSILPSLQFSRDRLGEIWKTDEAATAAILMKNLSRLVA